MDPAMMKWKNPNAIPTPFRGLRILLLDNDTSSLSDLSSKLGDYSYKVTTTEVPTIAQSILQDRADQFDLVMADINMPEMDCFEFIKSVHDIKNLPIILMSAELKKDMVEEARTKGACFFLKKPISSKTLNNVWQHVYRNNKNEKSKVEIKQDAKVPEKENVLSIVNEGPSPGPKNEQTGDSDEKDIGGADERRLTEISKRSVVPEKDNAGKLKRKRKDDKGIISSKKISTLSQELGDFHMQLDSTPSMKSLQETDTTNGSNLSEDSHLQTKFSMRKKQKMDLVKESGSSTSCVGEEE